MRSLTLDVRVWDGPVMALMAALGNAAANAVWEAALRRVSAQADSWVCPLTQPTSRRPRAGLDLVLHGRLGRPCGAARPAPWVHCREPKHQHMCVPRCSPGSRPARMRAACCLWLETWCAVPACASPWAAHWKNNLSNKRNWSYTSLRRLHPPAAGRCGLTTATTTSGLPPLPLTGDWPAAPA